MNPLALLKDKVIISHWDLDGLTSAALLSRRLRETTTILSTISALPRYLSQVVSLSSVVRIRDVYILDLNPQPGRLDEIYMLIRELRENDVHVTWIDHHEWEHSYRYHIEEAGAKVYIDTNEVTAGLVYRLYWDKPDEYASRLVELAYDDDFFLNKIPVTIKWRRILRWYRWNTRYNALRSFRRGEIWPRWAENLYRGIEKEYMALLRVAVSSTYTYYASGARIVVAENVDQRLHPGEVYEEILRSNIRGDVYIIMYPNGISIRSEKLDASEIAKILGGGGHRKAAGVAGHVTLKQIIKAVETVVSGK